MEFNSLESLFNHIDKAIEEELISTAKMVKKDVQDFIRDAIYYNDAHEYIRSGEFLGSVSVRVIDKNTVQIYYNTDLINPRPDPTGTGKWNQHMDRYKLEDMSENIPKWIELGTKGGLYPREGIHAMDNVIPHHANEYITDLKKFLILRGFTVV